MLFSLLIAVITFVPSYSVLGFPSSLVFLFWSLPLVSGSFFSLLFISPSYLVVLHSPLLDFFVFWSWASHFSSQPVTPSLTSSCPPVSAHRLAPAHCCCNGGPCLSSSIVPISWTLLPLYTFLHTPVSSSLAGLGPYFHYYYLDTTLLQTAGYLDYRVLEPVHARL